MRNLIRLLLTALVAALLYPVAARAVPVAVVASILSVSATSFIAAAATFAINTIITAAVNFGLSKLLGPKTSASQAAQDRQASILQLNLGEVSRELVIGEAATGGSLLGAFNYGGQYGTDWVVRAIALADHRSDSLVGEYINDTYVAFTGDGPVTGYNDQLEIYFRDGRAGQAFPADLMAAWRSSPLHSQYAPASDTPYTGMTYVVVAYKADAADAQSPIWSGAHPAFKWVLRGKPMYDPRQDDTAGGAGPQRWEDPSTWTWTNNLSVCRYNYERGIYALDQVDEPGMLLIGRGLSTYEAPPANCIVYANICDELVDNGAGGTEPRYCADGVIEATATYVSVEQLFADASGGYIIQPLGGVEVEPGVAKTPVATFTDDDLVAGQPVEFNDFISDADRVNTVIPRYIEPAQGWQDTAAPVQRDLDLVALDGPKETTVSLALVTRVTQAQRVGAIVLASRLLERNAKVVLPASNGEQCFAQLEEGDWVQWTSARRTKNLPVVFRIQAFGQDQTWQSGLSLQETAFDVYGFGGSPLPAPTGVSPTPVPDALALSGVTAVAIDKEGDSGAIIPAIRVGWDAPVDAGVLQIRAEVREAGHTEVAPTITAGVNDGKMDVTNGVGPDMALEVRLVPLGAPGRALVPSAWIPVSTGSLVAVASVTEIGGLTVAQFMALFDSAVAQGDQLTQAIMNLALKAIDDRNALVTQSFHNGKSVKKIVIDDGEDFTDGDYTIAHRLQLLGLVIDEGGAFQLNETTLKVSATETWADFKSGVTASFNAVNASISTEATARASADGALATSIGTVSTTVAGHTASITTIQTSLNGLTASYFLVVDAGTNRASIAAQAGGTLSTIIFSAGAIGFTDGVTNVFPLSISGGVVKASNFEADRVKANSIVTASLIGGAVTDVTWDEQTYGFNLSGSAVQIFSTAHTTTVGGAPHVINLNATLVNGAGDVGVLLTIKRDGTSIGQRSFFAQASFTVTGAFMVFDQPSSGAHTYTIEALATSGSGSNGNLAVSNMTIAELKK